MIRTAPGHVAAAFVSLIVACDSGSYTTRVPVEVEVSIDGAGDVAFLTESSGPCAETTPPRLGPCGVFELGTVVELEARPHDGAEFEGWTAPGCREDRRCRVTAFAKEMVVVGASFSFVNSNLVVSIVPSASGSSVEVRPKSGPRELCIGGDDRQCRATVPIEGARLVAIPSVSERFEEWSGECSPRDAPQCTPTDENEDDSIVVVALESHS